MKHVLAATFVTALGLAGVSIGQPASAQDNPVVVELYTSQGCSSCPPADDMMVELAERSDVIALALHVDYWDYIGWKDPFGNPAYAARQRAYAAEGQRRSIYTPEMIVMGQTDIVGAKPMALSKAIAEHAKAAPKVAVKLKREGDDLHIAVSPLDVVAGLMTVHLMRYAPMKNTEIMRGENSGKIMKNVNIVDDWHVLGTWDGQAPWVMQTTVTGPRPVVVIVQKHEVGPIMAAARLK
ncbi:hypothetical protein SAMN04488523_11320 [Sulfitobacter brevis]|uniref:DUF1223 domain-containing protein n=1 Tax=Sulfitobacter brevis TaxID=74348 RepID=A0A1I2ERV8_9RHOB|nr:DUF1223 domain-containing protein [Sulfitobacter brevis]SFE95051.1 hypothetical protein SAMN04488523_11320 [Sulfitobacter brevis]